MRTYHDKNLKHAWQYHEFRYDPVKVKLMVYKF